MNVLLLSLVDKLVQVGDVQNKFSSLAILESKSWRLPLADEEKVSANITSMVPQAKKGRKASSRPGSVSSEGLKDLINQGRRKMQTSKIPKVQVKHLAPGPLSIGAYFEKRWSGYQETFGSISMTEIVSGAHFPVSGAHF